MGYLLSRYLYVAKPPMIAPITQPKPMILPNIAPQAMPVMMVVCVSRKTNALICANSSRASLLALVCDPVGLATGFTLLSFTDSIFARNLLSPDSDLPQWGQIAPGRSIGPRHSGQRKRAYPS